MEVKQGVTKETPEQVNILTMLILLLSKLSLSTPQSDSYPPIMAEFQAHLLQEAFLVQPC